LLSLSNLSGTPVRIIEVNILWHHPTLLVMLFAKLVAQEFLEILLVAGF
jgi:hypothetical protein